MLDTELIPATEPDSKWLMVVLHGLGDSMEGYRWLPKALDLPWLNYLLVNAPDDYHGGYSWYDIYEDPEPGVVRSRAALVALLDNQREAGFASGKTFQFGFSQGCLMTMEIAMRYPHRLAGCIGISGYVHDPDTALDELALVAKEQEILFTYGTFDPIIPADKVKNQLHQLSTEGGLQVEAHEFAKEHTIAGAEELLLIRDFIRMRGPGG
jgi:phospholipase/carboxylesterase